MAVALFGVRRASDVTLLVGGDVHLNGEECVAQLLVKRQTNAQYVAGRMARLVTTGTWGVACPDNRSIRTVVAAQLLASASGPCRSPVWTRGGPPSIRGPGPRQIRVENGMAARKNVRGGLVWLPRKGGTRMYIMGGMSREATEEPGGWKTPSVLESVYIRAESEEMAPEMRGAIGRACALLAVEAFTKDLDREVSLGGSSGARQCLVPWSLRP